MLDRKKIEVTKLVTLWIRVFDQECYAQSDKHDIDVIDVFV